MKLLLLNVKQAVVMISANPQTTKGKKHSSCFSSVYLSFGNLKISVP